MTIKGEQNPTAAEIEDIERDIIRAFDNATHFSSHVKEDTDALMRLLRKPKTLLNKILSENFGVAYPDVFIKRTIMLGNPMLQEDLTGTDILWSTALLRESIDKRTMETMRAKYPDLAAK